MEYVLTVRNDKGKTPFVFIMSRIFWRELRGWLYTNVNIEISIDDREILFLILSFTGKN